MRPPVHSPTRPPHPSRGLTLVEAMCMILALGLVAALALPKMAEQRSRARATQVRQVALALQARLEAVRDRALAQGLDCRDPTPRPLHGGDETLTLAHCQPLATAEALQALLRSGPDLVNDDWRLAPPALTSPNVVLERTDAPQPAACALRYTAATAHSAALLEPLSGGC